MFCLYSILTAVENEHVLEATIVFKTNNDVMKSSYKKNLIYGICTMLIEAKMTNIDKLEQF